MPMYSDERSEKSTGAVTHVLERPWRTLTLLTQSNWRNLVNHRVRRSVLRVLERSESPEDGVLQSAVAW